MDEYYMRLAIDEGNKGRYTAPPNPWVGCVIVHQGKIIGQGYHQAPGQPHAEVNAISDAIEKGYQTLLEEASLYVTLEPCHHYGRTPPCDLLLIKHKIPRVIVALVDPDPRVSGSGISLLQEQGVKVIVGIGKAEAENSLQCYLHHRCTGLPWVLVKAGLSLDGRIACEDGSSQWITNAASRQDTHNLRALSQAILVGSGTALIDNPQLTVRSEIPHNPPIRVVLDSRGRVTQGHLLDISLAPTIIYYHQAPASTLGIWQEKGVTAIPLQLQGSSRLVQQSWPSPAEACEADLRLLKLDSKLPLITILEDLGKRGVLQLLVEGGSEVHGQFLSQDLVNEMVLYYGSGLIGGSGKPWIGAPITSNISALKLWRLREIRALGDNVKLTYTKG